MSVAASLGQQAFDILCQHTTLTDAFTSLSLLDLSDKTPTTDQKALACLLRAYEYKGREWDQGAGAWVYAAFEMLGAWDWAHAVPMPVLHLRDCTGATSEERKKWKTWLYATIVWMKQKQNKR